ncbi:hypothetical protein C2E23DRAFT_858819 [Lenzites betulinus]|nr:hypothetical protein C2E23DRAFT_858819 [Lenzites betulinus]
MSPYQWSLVNSSPTTGRVFSRTLDPSEHSFYYDRITNGTADVIWHYTVELADPAQGPLTFGKQNVIRAWTTVKQHYPLLAARMDPQTDGTVKFVVEERALSSHQPEEVTVRNISSVDEAFAVIWRGIRDKPMEDSHIISRVFILARTDKPGTYEVLFKAAHAISDGISGATLARTFLDVLSSPPFQTDPLEQRLAMAVPSNVLNPSLKMSLARQRWRRAIGKVTFFNMRKRLEGGHTLPRKVTDETYRTPATTARTSIPLTPSESRAVLDACKRNRITFGAAMPTLCQMALTRVLHRHYLRGDISVDEWEHRRRQPMHYGGPLNLRPYLDEAWQRAGGVAEMLLMIDYYDCTLPFMPTPYGTRRDAGVPRVDGAPPYSALLARSRFFHRARVAKEQLARTVKHPLLLELAHARQPLYLIRKKRVAAHWQASVKGEPLPPFPELEHADASSPDYCLAGALSSIGDMSAILPENYPLPTSHPLCIRTAHSPPSPAYGVVGETAAPSAPAPRPPTTSASAAALRMVDSQTYLHGRPMELILGNSTAREEISLALTYDANVYKGEDAEEYLQEVRLAALYYLGETESGAIKGKL